jgi:hypothetical protein
VAGLLPDLDGMALPLCVGGRLRDALAETASATEAWAQIETLSIDDLRGIALSALHAAKHGCGYSEWATGQ